MGRPGAWRWLHVLTKAWEKTEARSWDGNPSKRTQSSLIMAGRGVISSVCLSGSGRWNDGARWTRRRPPHRCLCEECKNFAGERGRPERTLGGSHLLLRWIHRISGFRLVKCYTSALILWTWSSVTLQPVRSPLQDLWVPLWVMTSLTVWHIPMYLDVQQQPISTCKLPWFIVVVSVCFLYCCLPAASCLIWESGASQALCLLNKARVGFINM